jgi:lipoprotein-anchoring transpeptidase ErfK/SrfK
VVRLFVLTLLLLAVGVGGLAFADHKAASTLADGTRVAGVNVGGLTRDQALRRVRTQLGREIGRPIQVQVGERSFTLSAEEARVRIDLDAAVDRAYAAGRDGNVATRGWRALTGGNVAHDERAVVSVDRSRVRRFVNDIHRRLAHRAVDAKLEMTVDRVSVKPAQWGVELAGRKRLISQVTNALRTRSATRVFHASIEEIPPVVTTEQVLDAQPVAVTVSRDDTTVRVFDRGKLVKTYRVAVGEPKFPTPTGEFTVQSMQKNPAWNVPQSEWAGKLAGKVIPAGDPRNPIIARWVGFNGSVGFHGTKSLGSLGSAASHGCVRMDPDDVSDLYERVEVGTPVLVA